MVGRGDGNGLIVVKETHLTNTFYSLWQIWSRRGHSEPSLEGRPLWGPLAVG